MIAPQKFFPRNKDGSAGGGWGEECRAVRAQKPRRTAQKLLGRNRAEISLSFLEFFSGGHAQKKNCKGKFLRGCRRSVSGGGRRGESVRFRSEPPRAPRVRQSGFCSKKVRISSKRYRQVLHSAKLKEFASAQSASASNLDFSKCDSWRCFLNEVRTFFAENPEN